MVRPKRFGFVQVPHLLYCTLECSVHGYWNGCGVGWSDLALFCHVRKREHCCRSGTFLKAQFRKKLAEFGCALAAKFSNIKITETITSENNRQQESSKQKKGLHFLGPKMGKHFWTWSKENKYFKFLFIFSFSKKSKQTFPTGAASKNVLTLFSCVPILG